MVDIKDSDLAKEKALEGVEKGTTDTPRHYRRRRRITETEQGASTWLISFADVMALMLTFFVLLFAMSHPKMDEWKEMTNAVQKNFNKFYGQPLERGHQETLNIEKVNFSKALNLTYLRTIIEKLILQESALRNVQVIELDDRLIISLPQDLLFEVGEAEVKSTANKALFALAGTLNRIKNRLEIAGHADPRPTGGNSAYGSNWSLSLARGMNVAATLENVGYAKDVTVRGMSSGRYYDLSNDFTEDEKLDLSRRVDLIVMKDDGKRLKLFDIGLP